MHVGPPSRPQFCRLLAPYTVQKCTHTRFEQYVFVVSLADHSLPVTSLNALRLTPLPAPEVNLLTALHGVQ